MDCCCSLEIFAHQLEDFCDFFLLFSSQMAFHGSCFSFLFFSKHIYIFFYLIHKMQDAFMVSYNGQKEKTSVEN